MSAAPRRRLEKVATRDGWTLGVTVIDPVSPVAVVVAGHAMMVDRRTLDFRRDGLVSQLARRGLAVIAADLRGHGGSGPLATQGGAWSYDDLVREDTPALYRFARERFAGLPLCAVGHSLFGHVALAHAAEFPEAAPDRIVMLGGNVWCRRWEPSALRWAQKRAFMETSLALVAAAKRFPARALRLGTTDEAPGYWRQLASWTRSDDWMSGDGVSWRERLADVPSRVLSIAGAGDTLLCHSESARGLVRELRRGELLTVGRATGLPRDPGHMGLVTDAICRPVWDRVADFARG